MSTKKLCKWDKDRIQKKSETLQEQLRDPQFYCTKCARAARDRKRLCKPTPLN